MSKSLNSASALESSSKKGHKANLRVSVSRSDFGQDLSSSQTRGRSLDKGYQRLCLRTPSRSKSPVSIEEYRKQTVPLSDENKEIISALYKVYCTFKGEGESSRLNAATLIKLFRHANLLRVKFILMIFYPIKGNQSS